MEYWEDQSHKLILHPNKTIKKALVSKSASVQISYFEHPIFGKVEHLWIRRHDSKPMGWSQLQRIKNEVSGSDKMAVQVFPKESNLIDQANMYHLWVFENEFGINENSFRF